MKPTDPLPPLPSDGELEREYRQRLASARRTFGELIEHGFADVHGALSDVDRDRLRVLEAVARARQQALPDPLARLHDDRLPPALRERLRFDLLVADYCAEDEMLRRYEVMPSD